MDERQAFPLFWGSAATAQGAVALIDALTQQLPDVAGFPSESAAFRALPPFAGASAERLERLEWLERPEGSGGSDLPEVLESRVDVARTAVDQCVEALEALRVLESAVAARVAAVIERLESASAAESAALGFDRWQCDSSELATKAEIATALHISEGAASSLITHSLTLVRDQPATLSELAAGKISWAHAVVVADETHTLRCARVPELDITSYEDALLDRAGCSTPTQFKGAARRLRERSHPESINHQTKSAYAKRRMELQRDRDGMSWINLYVPAPAGEGIWDLATTWAQTAKSPTEQRTLTQLRVDIATALLLGQGPEALSSGMTLPKDCPNSTVVDPETGERWAICSDGWAVSQGELGTQLPPMPRVLPIITIPLLSLLGVGNAPPELEGYGPISIDVAKRLTANAPSFYRVLTDPLTGEALAVNPDSRRVTAKMRAFLRSQDAFCAFPGCNAKASTSDYDHIIPWSAGGQTTEDQVEALCKKHHRVKHLKDDRTATGRLREEQTPERASVKLRGWRPVMTSSGRPAWTSPSGRYHPPQSRDLQLPAYPKWLRKRLDQAN